MPEFERGHLLELKHNWRTAMRSNFRIAMVLFAGVAIGAIAVEGLHAQGAKLKAYVVAENDVLDARAGWG